MAVQNRLAHAEEEKEDTGLLFLCFVFLSIFILPC